jgi:hypothetical protein
MIGLGKAALKIYVALQPCDMRKSFNGLYALAEETLKEDPKSGALFTFTNQRRNRIKLLYHGQWSCLGRRMAQARGRGDEGRTVRQRLREDRRTPIKYLAPAKARRPRAICGPVIVRVETRSITGIADADNRLENIIPHAFAGTFQCEAFGAFRNYTRKHGDIAVVGCWAHARRKFHEAFVQG